MVYIQNFQLFYEINENIKSAKALDQLMNLKVGEVLSFNPPDVAEINVNDFPLYHATVGEAGKKVAVQIVDSVYEEDI